MVWGTELAVVPAKVIPRCVAVKAVRISVFNFANLTCSVASSFSQASRATALANKRGSEEDSGVRLIPKFGSGFFHSFEFLIAKMPIPAGPCQLVASKIALSQRFGNLIFAAAV